MRLIDADLLKEEIHCSYSDDLEILDKIDRQPTVNKWIPCKDRLPNMTESQKNHSRIGEPVEFNVMIKGADNPTTLEYTADGFWIDESFSTYIVVAWQPLPEPYKEK